ncbi:MAG: addiction module protein [Gemmataceae bacterium]
MTPPEATTEFSPALAALWPAIEALSPEDKAQLLDKLTDEGLADPAWEKAWDDEIARRIADVEAGRVKLIDGEEFMKQLAEKYG